jgi:hypothetical protein
MAPISSHTRKSKHGDPSDLAIAAGVRNIPIAIVWPAMMAVAEPKPSSRFSPVLDTASGFEATAVCVVN